MSENKNNENYQLSINHYPLMKSSGINWIGDIPEHWEVKRLKFFAKVNSPVSSFEIDKSSNDEVVFLPMEKVSEGGEINQELRKQINEASSGFTYFEKGDVILAKITPCFENGKGALLKDLETDFGFGSTEFHTLRASATVSPKLLFYITKSHSFRTLGEAFMSGSAGQKRVSTDFVKDFPIAFPTLPEQTAIAEYLDEKTAQIDKLIAEKRRLIELLKEERLGVINQAVTRGINPHAKLKPSGIAWLGDIPEQSQVLPIKYFVSTKVTDGPHETPQILAEGVPFVSAESVKNGKIDFNFKRGFISEEQDSIYSKKCKPRRNDIFIVKSGSTTGKIAIVDFDDDFNVWSPLALVRTDECKAYSWFIYYALQSDYFQDQIRFSWSFGTQPNIGMNVIENLKVIVPYEPNEQKQIVEFIENATGKIDATIATIEQEIGFLGEYRTALISEVVTGKIRVTEN